MLSSSWQGAAVPWLVLCLLGFAAGLWPEAIVHPKTPRSMSPLPTLPALAAAQVIFLLLAYPVIVLRRAEKHPHNFCPGRSVAELAVLVAAAVPFSIAAAWFSDGGIADIIRTAMCVATFIPLSAGLCAWTLPARKPAARATALILALTTTAGLSAAVYIAHEFLRPAWADALWQTAPVTLAWTTATAPAPLAPLTFWLLAGLATIVAAWMTAKEPVANSQ